MMIFHHCWCRVKDSRKKPKKPYPSFPLFAHHNGQWAKKVCGKLRYFGPWEDPAAARDKWNREKDYLLAGKEPPTEQPGLRVSDLVSAFLASKQRQVSAGHLTERTLYDYRRSCDLVESRWGNVAVDSLTPADFEAFHGSLARKLGPVALGNEVQRIRTIFRYAHSEGLISSPVPFGQFFRKPPRRTVRAGRQPRLFSAGQVKRMLKVANVHFRAMILLGINCGFGNADVGLIELSHLDLDAGWHKFPRPKTAVPRRAPLWPETVRAVRLSLEQRAEPKRSASRYVFVTKYGNCWYKDAASNPLSWQFRKIRADSGVTAKGLTFYALRHTFETVAGECKDQVAVDWIMGHADESMAAVYREGISDERLLAASNTVRRWLYGLPRD